MNKKMVSIFVMIVLTITVLGGLLGDTKTTDDNYENFIILENNKSCSNSSLQNSLFLGTCEAFYHGDCDKSYARIKLSDGLIYENENTVLVYLPDDKSYDYTITVGWSLSCLGCEEAEVGATVKSYSDNSTKNGDGRWSYNVRVWVRQPPIPFDLYAKFNDVDNNCYGSDRETGYIKFVLAPNNPPNTPSTPSGPSSGSIGTTYTYYTSATDPDNDSVSYRFDWDGTYSGWSPLYPSGTTTGLNHTWSQAGTYHVKAQAKDEHGDTSSWSAARTVTIKGNTQPNKPSTPTGETAGKTGTSYPYSTSITDPDGDQVYYNFSWGDGTYSGWIGPNNSGDTVTQSHIWNTEGTFSVKVKARDIKGAESVWSDPLTISMHKNKDSTVILNPLFQQFLELLQDRSPRIIPFLP